MSRYIERKVVINKVNEIPAHFNSGDIRYGVEIAIQAIKDTPTADVAEVRHGEWLKHYRSGTTVSDGYVSSCCDMWNERKSQYCPHCGAKMDGERKNEE